MTDYYVYISSWTNFGGTGGIGIYRMDGQTGALQHRKTCWEDVSFGMSILDRERGLLYALNEAPDLPEAELDAGGGSIFVFRVDPMTGDLTLLQRRPSFGANPCYITLDQERQFALVAHHASHAAVTQVRRGADGKYHILVEHDDVTLCLYPLREDGSVDDPVDVVKHTGWLQSKAVPNPGMHTVCRAPLGGWLAVVDIGESRIHKYRIDREHGRLYPCAAPYADEHDSLPRYCLFHPTQPYLYVNHEMGSLDVNVFRYDVAGELELLGKVSSVPEDHVWQYHDEQQDMRLHPSGRYLYDAVNGPDCISVFQIDEASGMLTLIQNQKLCGRWARSCAVSPCGRFLIATCLKSGDIEVYPIQENGTLAACGGDTGTTTPSDAGNTSSGSSTSDPDNTNQTGASRDADGNGRIDKVYYALPADPVNLLPWDSKGNQRKIFYAAIYDTLFDFIDGEYVPNVATGYTEVDELHWEVKIHDNVTDWEGNPLTAHDIVFCYENYVNSGFAVKFDSFGGLEATDDYTLLFTWTAPITGVAALDHVLCNVQLYTEAAWDESKFATSPVATGPYKLVEYVSGSKVVVEVNEDYWNEEPTEMRLQNADAIEYSIVIEGAQNVIGLQTGALDMSSNVPAEDFATFAADSNYYTASVPTNEIYVLLVNCETVSDPNLRKALFYAIDSEALSTIINGSSPTKAYGSPASPDYVEAWEDMETFYNTYDVEKAKALLADSSYGGETLHMTCLNEEAYKNMATMIQVFWEQIGVKSDIETIDSAIQSAYSTDSSKWDINVTNAGGSFLVNSMNRLYNTTDFGGTYSNGFVVDEKLWELFGTANNAATWGEESLTELYEYITDMGYHYVLMYMNASAVASNVVTGFYYWDSVILPHCCTYDLG